MQRRAFLEVAAAAGLTLGATCLPGCADDAGPYNPLLPPVVPPPLDEDALAEAVSWMLATPQAQLLDRARAELVAGLPLATFEAAIGLATLRQIPSFAGGDSHRLLAWQALRAPRALMPPRASLAWALWSLHDVAAPTAALAWGRPDYRAPGPAPAGVDHVAAYETAVRCADPRASEAAALARFAAGGWTAVVDVLLRMGVSSIDALDHTAIVVAHVDRAVSTLPAGQAEAFVRFVARTQAYAFERGRIPVQDVAGQHRWWRANRALAAQLQVDALAGTPDEAATLLVLAAARAGDVAAALQTVLGLRTAGVAAASLWDGLVCAAAELMWTARPGHSGHRAGEVHALTNVNAMRTGFLHAAASDVTRWLLLLQATAFVSRFDLGGERRPFETLVADASLGDTLAAMREHLGAGEPEFVAGTGDVAADEASQRAVAGALLAAVQAGADPVALVREQLEAARITAKGAHAAKFMVALLEESGRVAPTYRQRLVPAMAFMLAGAKARSWPAADLAESIAAELAG